METAGTAIRAVNDQDDDSNRYKFVTVLKAKVQHSIEAMGLPGLNTEERINRPTTARANTN